ncbi:MAG TPA: dTDP-4-dehydrorhamnose reductase [Burkholderiaceae bacterium]|nr:dTDP-4-dehydrorhamnose reductase [Burkholderiaceae bacterium]
MKILLTGGTGQVGWELQRCLARLGEVLAPDRSVLDLGRPDTLAPLVRSVGPDLIVNAAAYTAVDRAESEGQACFAVNAESVAALAQEAARLGALLVHYSTDYVFDGAKRSAYVESDPTGPINAYGRSKLAGEREIARSGCRHLILRTGWVYAMRGRNFLLTMLRLARERPQLRVVDDQVGAPTWARDIAQATLIGLDRPTPIEGLYHVTAGGEASWFQFAGRILKLAGLTTTLVPIPTSDYPTPAARPAYSVLDSGRFESAARVRIGIWDERLVACFGDSGSLAG